MNELSLFTGIGGGLLGTKLLGWRCIGAVEIEKYPCQVLQQRIDDGCFEPFPIWNIDIREFNARYAQFYTRLVDVITAGFPCQPFSVAGKGQAEKDDRNMWPETKRAIQIIRPAFVLLENVPGLLTHDYAITIFNDLAEIGYEVLPPLKLGADDVGANHRRKRIWILAYAAEEQNHKRKSGFVGKTTCGWESSNSAFGISGQDVADTKHNGLSAAERSRGIETRSRDNQARQKSACKSKGCCEQSGELADTSESGLEGEIATGELPGKQSGLSAECGWWATEPDVGRVAYGIPHRVDRLKAIGNAQVPAVVKAVWGLLTDDA